MTIDPKIETLLKISELIPLLPFANRKSYNTVKGWIDKGVKVGNKTVYLEARPDGGGVVTSLEAFYRWMDAINPEDLPE